MPGKTGVLYKAFNRKMRRLGFLTFYWKVSSARAPVCGYLRVSVGCLLLSYHRFSSVALWLFHCCRSGQSETGVSAQGVAGLKSMCQLVL